MAKRHEQAHSPVMELAPADFEHIADLPALYRRPGFLMRRAHQIYVSLFLEEAAPIAVTAPQYSMLYILRARPGLDQIGLAKLSGLDRSTTGLVLGKLERDGLVVRRSSPDDRRRKELALTAAGLALMQRLAEPVRRTHDRAMAALTPDEHQQLVALLHKFVTTHNQAARTPLTGE